MELTQEHVDRCADVLIWGLKTARTNPFKRNDIILIRYDKPALDLAEALYMRLIDRGMNVIPRMGLSWTMERDFFTRAGRRQITFVPPGEDILHRALNGTIVLRAPESLTHLSDVDPKKIGTALLSRKPLREILDRREETGDFGWTLTTYPTGELARRARLSFSSYTDQVIRACFLDEDDPVKKWREIYRHATRIKKWLNSLDVRRFHVESEHTDLTLRRGEARKWIGISGHNIPSFELFLSPDWHGASGTYHANQPTYRSGNYVEGIHLLFERGRVRTLRSDVGEAFARKQITIDGGANRIGEFSLTDVRFSRINRFMADTLYDENYGGEHGNCHIALGASYSDTYDGDPAELTVARKKALGFNDSALHWDLVNTEPKTVTAHLSTGKRRIIYEAGRFAY